MMDWERIWELFGHVENRVQEFFDRAESNRAGDRRERVATAIAAGMVADGGAPDLVAARAVQAADRLIARLDS